MSSTFASRNRRTATKKAVSFSLMVVGASGTGKTTFANTLCGGTVLPYKLADDPVDAAIQEPVQLKPLQVELQQDNQRIGLTIVDTPGFGDNLDNAEHFDQIVA